MNSEKYFGLIRPGSLDAPGNGSVHRPEVRSADGAGTDESGGVFAVG